ncbi:hypothetical protein APHAL10511_005387 [Amanita phalloides]|nr:hypothetical protein APHAL10511_005387 [Amanita phalloides]
MEIAVTVSQRTHGVFLLNTSRLQIVGIAEMRSTPVTALMLCRTIPRAVVVSGVPWRRQIVAAARLRHRTTCLLPMSDTRSMPCDASADMPCQVIPERFPFEIVGLFMKELSHCKASLAHCALVSSSWLQLSRGHLFEKVELVPENYGKFLELLQSDHCSISYAVQNLSLVESDFALDKWIDRAIYELEKWLPSVVRLRIYGLTWNDLSFASEQALVNGFKRVIRLHLEYLYLDDMATLLGFLCSFPALESLHCKHIMLNVDRSDQSHIALSHFQLPSRVYSIHVECPEDVVLNWLDVQSCLTGTHTH